MAAWKMVNYSKVNDRKEVPLQEGGKATITTMIAPQDVPQRYRIDEQGGQVDFIYLTTSERMIRIDEGGVIFTLGRNSRRLHVVSAHKGLSIPDVVALIEILVEKKVIKLQNAVAILNILR